jgi:hypothetical protein
MPWGRLRAAADSSQEPAAATRISRHELLLTVAIVGVACLLLWSSPFLLPLRLLVTLVHEAGHALVALLCGASVQSLTINPHEGGLTSFSLSRPGTLRLVAIGSAGYVGTAIVGGLLLASCGRMRSGRRGLIALAVAVAAILLAWVPWSIRPDGASAAASGSSTSDGRYTIVFSVLAVIALVGLAWQHRQSVRRIALVAIATALCLGAVEDLSAVLRLSRKGGHSDATIVARVAPFPAWAWATVWLLLGVAACGLGIWAALRPESRPSDGLLLEDE